MESHVDSKLHHRTRYGAKQYSVTWSNSVLSGELRDNAFKKVTSDTFHANYNTPFTLYILASPLVSYAN
jgi:hypothetical protein